MEQYLGHERDAYGLASLVNDLKDEFPSDDDYTNSFIDNLNLFFDPTPSNRPYLKILLNEDFFKNDYLHVRKFLEQVTMKSAQEKEDFFRTVGAKLHKMPEKVVARKLSHLLLARFVLLDRTANKHLIPSLLSPCQKRNLVFNEGRVNPLFTINYFKKFIIPRLCIILTVKDAAIRLVLLRYFHHFVKLIPKPTLQHEILPKLLVGLKDTNDVLVAATLKALADIVPILGGEIVIGGQRSKLFSNALPKDENVSEVEGKDHTDKFLTESLEKEKNVLMVEERNEMTNIFLKKTENVSEDICIANTQEESVQTKQDSSSESFNSQLIPKNVSLAQDWLKLENIPERSSPDGGEDPKVVSCIPEIEENSEEWSDWGGIDSDHEENSSLTASVENISAFTNESVEDITGERNITLLSISENENSDRAEESPVNRLKTLTPNRNPLKLTSKSSKSVCEASKMSENVILLKKERSLEMKKTEFRDLDIFSSVNVSKKDDEFDLFKDMQPNITKSSSADVNFPATEPEVRSGPTEVKVKKKSSFAINAESNDQIESGWGDDLEWDVLP